MKTKNVIFLIFLMLLLAVVFIYIQVRYIINAKWVYSGFKIKDIDLQKIRFYIYFKINNPGILSFIISEQDYSIFINNAYISRVTNRDDTELKSGGVSTLPFLIELKYSDLGKTAIDNLTVFLNKEKRKNIKVRISGVLTLKMGPVRVKKYPFDLQSTLGELTAPDPDEIPQTA